MRRLLFCSQTITINALFLYLRKVVGNFVEFGKDQCGFILDCYHKYGPCYSMGMMGQNLTFLVGPDVSAAFFAAKDEELSQPEVYGFMKPVFGENVVYDAAPKVRKQQMSHMTQGLATSRLKAYVPMIVAETEQFFKENWGESGEVDILQVVLVNPCRRLWMGEERLCLCLEVVSYLSWPWWS
jgi:sterol 14-demethylase